MRVPISWLRDFVEVALPAGEIARRLTDAGLEIEGVETVGPTFDKIVVARIETLRRHPEADRLSLCEVTDGTATRPIVCGASNMKVGDKVALALEGAALPNGAKIKRSKIRGQVSEGMLCSARELGLGDDHAGILILPEGAPLGAPLADAMGLGDAVLSIKVYPNRPDLLSVRGVAREVAAVSGARLARRELAPSRPTGGRVPVSVEDAADCARYVGRWIAGVRVGPSPAWLQRRLEAAGMRPRDAVVDVTNYVMLELGQPLHAFDAETLAGPRIEVRRARPGERLKTLDGVERALDPEVLVIADANGPVAIAGIMGGEPTEVTDRTRAVFLESASFTGSVVRRGARRLGLHTEASYRFERRVDPEGCLEAIDRATALLAELAIPDPAARAQALADTTDTYPAPPAGRRVSLSVARLNRLIGFEPPMARETAAGYLERLDLSVVREADPDRLTVDVPSFRADIDKDVDLAEEVVRLHGYDAVPYTLPRVRPASDVRSAATHLAERAREALVGCGFAETISFAFVAPSAMDRLGLPQADSRRAPLALKNPLSVEMSVMRTTLLPGLLAAVETNVRQGARRMRLFEVGKVFLCLAGEKLPAEPTQLAAILIGPREPAGWNRPEVPADLFDATGVVERLAQALRVPGLAVVPVGAGRPPAEPYLHPSLAGWLEIPAGRRGAANGHGGAGGGVVVGSVGALHPDLAAGLDLDGQPAFLIELSLDVLAPHAAIRPAFRPVPRFPAVLRDLALILDVSRPAREVLELAWAERQPLLRDVTVFDLYEGPPVPPGRRSLGLTITYQADDRTLTDEEVNRVHTRLTQRLTQALGAEIR